MSPRSAALGLALLVTPLAGCGGTAPGAPTAGAGSVQPSPAAPPADPAPSAAGSTGSGLVVAFGVVQDASGGDEFAISYDELDYRAGSCQAQGGQGTVQAQFTACWSNVNPRRRTARVAETGEISRLVAYYPYEKGVRDRDEQVGFAADELGIVLEPAPGRRPNEVSVWRIVLQAGVVVELQELDGLPLTPTQAAEAAAAS